MTRIAFVAPGSLDLLSLASIDVDGVSRDWQTGFGEEWEPIYPSLTVATVLERAPDLIDDRDDASALRADPAQGLDEDLQSEFQQTEGFDEWRDSFAPMMDYAWPVELALDVDAQVAADLIDQFAGSVSLIVRGLDHGVEPEYEIALTGGGQDMTADLAIAYLCCGCVPPLKVLYRLGEVGENERLKRFPVAAAFERAFEWMDARHRDLTTQLHKIERPADWTR